MALKIPVSILLATNAETGEEIILPSERDLADAEKDILLDEEEAQRLIALGGKDRDKGESILAICANRRSTLERLIRHRDEAVPKSVRRDFVLVKPTLGEWMDAEEAATRWTSDGMPYKDDARLRSEVLPKCVEGLTPQQVRALEPIIGLHLWGRLQTALWPSQERIAFLS